MLKSQKDEINDIYNVLSKIKTNSLSQTGREQLRILGTRSIKGFLKQKILHKEILKKLNDPTREFYNNNNNNKDYDNKQTEDELNQFYKEHIINNSHIKSTIASDNSSSINSFTTCMRKLSEEHKHILQESKAKKHKPAIQRSKPTQFQLRRDLIKYIQNKKKKIPLTCIYNPNYNAISKHVPYARIKPLKENNNNNNDNTMNNSIETPSLMYNKSALLFHKIKGMSFDKYSSRNEMSFKSIYKDTLLDPKKMKRKITVPNFKKMMSRDYSPHKYNKQLPCLMNYTPNYNAIYCNKLILQKCKKDLKLERKKQILKKIWGSFDVSKEYIVVPSMNNVSIMKDNNSFWE